MIPRGYTGAAEAYIGLGQIDEAIAILELGLERTGDESIRRMLEQVLLEHGETHLLEIGRMLYEHKM
jgi:uncharacterized protein HemY